jgi:hypothetical protein
MYTTTKIGESLERWYLLGRVLLHLADHIMDVGDVQAWWTVREIQTGERP